MPRSVICGLVEPGVMVRIRLRHIPRRPASLRKSKVPHHGGNFRFIHQPVGHRHRLLRFARVIPLHQHNLFAFDAAGGVISATACEAPFQYWAP